MMRGRVFLFMGEEYHLQVGTKDYYVDLVIMFGLVATQ